MFVRSGISSYRSWNFEFYLVGQTLSSLGDAFAVIALPLLVLRATGSIVQMGLVTGTVGGGQLLACIVSGIIVDSVDRRRLMFACDIARMLVYAALSFVFCCWGPAMWIIYVVAGLGGFFGNVHQVAGITAVATLVPREKLVEANGRMQALFSLMYLVGPVLAGVTCSRFGPVVAIGIDAMSFLVSAIFILFTRWHRSASRRSGITTRKPVIEQLLAGIRFLLEDPVLRWVTVVQTIFNFLYSASRDLFVYHLKTTFGQDDTVVGIVFGVAAVGAICAGLLAPRLRRRYGFAICWLSAGVLQALALVMVGVASSVVLISALATVFIGMQTMRTINSITLRQEITPDHLLGRVSAGHLFLLTAPVPIGAALTTAMAARWGVPSAFLMLGAVGGAAALLAWMTSVRTYSP